MINYKVPKNVIVQLSNDGTTWTTVISKAINVPIECWEYQSQKYKYNLNSNGRYVSLLFEDSTQGPLLELSEFKVDLELGKKSFWGWLFLNNRMK